MIVDIERIGDYSKNILDLAMNYPDALNTKHLHKDLYDIEKAVKERFDNTVDAVKTQDIKIARDLLKGYKEHITGASDRIVNNIIAGNIKFGTGSEAAAIALYARYLKRIGSHLKNITTTIVNPIDTIGYTVKK
jgi:phosphate uptake regulator